MSFCSGVSCSGVECNNVGCVGGIKYRVALGERSGCQGSVPHIIRFASH